MRRIPLAAVGLLLLAAGPVFAQFPVSVQPLPFTPYVPPVRSAGLSGNAYLYGAVPDIRLLAGASFYNTDFERVYRWMYGPRPITLRSPAPEPAPPPKPEFDPTRVIVTLEVDDTDEVWVEEYKLRQQGRTRQFISPELPLGESFRYTVTVRSLNRVRKVELPVQAGDRPSLMLLPR